MRGEGEKWNEEVGRMETSVWGKRGMVNEGLEWTESRAEAAVREAEVGGRGERAGERAESLKRSFVNIVNKYCKKLCRFKVD